MASLVAGVVGWPASRAVVTRLVASARRLGPCSTLAVKLAEARCVDAAFAVGNATCALLTGVDLNALAAEDLPALASYAAMAVRLEETRATSNPKRIWDLSEKLRGLDAAHLAPLIVSLWRTGAESIGRLMSCRGLYSTLCRCFVDKMDAAAAAAPADLAPVTAAFFGQPDAALLRRFVDKLCRASARAPTPPVLDAVVAALPAVVAAGCPSPVRQVDAVFWIQSALRWALCYLDLEQLQQHQLIAGSI